MTEEYPIEEHIDFFRELLLAPPENAATLQEISDGFTEQRAQQILDDPDRLNHLKVLAAHIEPGIGWLRQSLSDTAPASAQLCHIALTQRPNTSEEHIDVVHADETLLRPENRTEDPALLARLDLPGGWAAWHPALLEAAPIVGYSGEPPQWLPQLLGDQASDDVVAGRDRTTYDNILCEPHPVSRYALGKWLLEHAMPTPPAAVLRAELGALALKHAELLGGPDAARALLADAAPMLLRVWGEVARWAGPRRELGEAEVSHIVGAFLSAHPDADDAPALAAALADGVAAAERPTRLGFALAAGGEAPEVEPEPHPLVATVAAARRDIVESVDDGMPGWAGHPARPFLAELLVLGS